MHLAIPRQGRLYPSQSTTYEMKFLRYALLPIMTAILLAVIVPVLSARSQPQPKHLLAGYEHLFPGHTWREVEADGFDCGLIANSESQYCTLMLVSGPFSQINVRVQGETIVRTSFIVRPDRYVIGDLALSWGTPQIKRNGEAINYIWPSIGGNARSTDLSERVNYFLPLTRVWMTLAD